MNPDPDPNPNPNPDPNPKPSQACAPFALRFWRVLPAMRPQFAPSALLEEHQLDRLKVRY